jgi:hypothetical protein
MNYILIILAKKKKKICHTKKKKKKKKAYYNTHVKNKVRNVEYLIFMQVDLKGGVTIKKR